MPFSVFISVSSVKLQCVFPHWLLTKRMHTATGHVEWVNKKRFHILNKPQQDYTVFWWGINMVCGIMQTPWKLFGVHSMRIRSKIHWLRLSVFTSLYNVHQCETSTFYVVTDYSLTSHWLVSTQCYIQAHFDTTTEPTDKSLDINRKIVFFGMLSMLILLWLCVCV